MGLAKKGSRTIRVDDDTYRWVVSPDDGYMSIIAELEPGLGQRLEATVSYDDQAGHGQQTRITPATVRRVITVALEEGWAPKVVGLPPFQLPNADDEEPDASS